jgi:hypothetical protein
MLESHLASRKMDYKGRLWDVGLEGVLVPVLPPGSTSQTMRKKACPVCSIERNIVPSDMIDVMKEDGRREEGDSNCSETSYFCHITFSGCFSGSES